MDFPLARQRFYQEIHQASEQVNLARAALYLAQEEYPQLDVEEWLNALDTMSAEVEERLSAERYPMRMIQTLNRYLFDDLGYCGNTRHYYDPRNSYLNQVLERRTGIPITLSLVYVELARRLQFPMVGVGMPGHFLIRPVGDELTIFVDPFNRGNVLFPDDCQELLGQMYGGEARLKPEFLEPVTPHQFLGRMLTNLKVIYLQAEDIPKAVAAIERILLLFPEAVMERRDRGILYYQLGRYTEAVQDLEAYLECVPYARDAKFVQQLLDTIQEG